MPPRGERAMQEFEEMASNETAEAMADVRKIERERVAAERADAPEGEPVSAETLQALSEVFSMQRERVKGEQMSPEQVTASMAMMDKIVADVESRTDEMRDAEKEAPEWDLRVKVAKGIHELGESINAAEQLTWEAVVDAQRAPEQFGLQMRMDAARSALTAYEALAGQVSALMTEGKNLPMGHRKQLVEQAQRIVGLIDHEKKIYDLAQKNFIDNMDAKVAEYQRQLDERSAAA